MKKLIILIALLLAIRNPQPTLTPTEASPSAQLKTITQDTEVENTDNRVVALEKVFAKYNSPLQGQGANYVKYADKHGIDWKLLPAISGLESTFARHMMPGSHNAYGWGGGHIYFDSWEEGIDHISGKLRTNYYDRGADTIYKIGPIYAEASHWPATVTKFAGEINAEYVALESENSLSLTI